MAIQSVALPDGPRPRERTADDIKLAHDIAKAMTDGKAATDGVKLAKADALKAAARLRRLLAAVPGLVPDGQEVRATIRPNGEGHSWYLYFAPMPAEPRKRRPRKSESETPAETPATTA